MLKTSLLALLALAGCFGGKPAAAPARQTAGAGDISPFIAEGWKCVVMINNVPGWIMEGYLKMPVSDYIISNGVEAYCPCSETIRCEGIDYCIACETKEGKAIPFLRAPIF